MKTPDLIALTSFALAGLLVLKTGVKRTVLLLISLGMLALVFSVVARIEKKPLFKDRRPAEETPAKRAISEEEMRKLIQKISASRQVGWSEAYPHGYIIFGALAPRMVKQDAFGAPAPPPDREREVVHEAHLHEADVQMDFTAVGLGIDHKREVALISVPNMVVSYANGDPPLEFAGNLEQLRFVERQPVQSMSSPKVFFEILDTEKRIFVMGFK